MGILKLMDFVRNKFPKAIKAVQIQNQYKNKILTIDSSNWLYQFLIKTQSLQGSYINTPTDSMGNRTGHLIGMMSRVAFCAQNDIRTIWVFDGKPPQQKKAQLKRRRMIRQQAEQKMEIAILQGQIVDLLKNSQRSLYITQAQKIDAQKMIQLMGLPVIRSPSEAQPQCASIVKSGLAYATISQDTDTLTFDCPRLIRSFSKPGQCTQVQLQNLLQQMQFTYDEFIDFCILCGCDYTTRIKNIGVVTAYKFIKNYGNIQNVLQQIAKDDKLYKRHPIDDQFNHLVARQLFKNPQVLKFSEKQINTNKLQEDELLQFLKDRQFNQARVNNWLKRIKNTNFYNQFLV